MFHVCKISHIKLLLSKLNFSPASYIFKKASLRTEHDEKADSGWKSILKKLDLAMVSSFEV